MGSDQARGVLRFGDFEADLDRGVLRRNGARVRLQEQPFQVLSVLLQAGGQVVTREELRRRVWPEDTFVEFDHALNTAVKKIRIALGDLANSPRYIETIPKRGYRFIVAVQGPADLSEEPVASVLPESPVAEKKSRRSTWYLIVGVGAVVAVLLGFMGSYRRRMSVLTAPRVVAVLPFENFSADHSQGASCDGITQEVITQLGRSDPANLKVTPRANVLPYRHSSKSVAQIGSELKADYLMEGSVRRDGRQVRVSAELIRVRDQSRIWGDEFDAEDDVHGLEVESGLAQAISAKARSVLMADAEL